MKRLPLFVKKNEIKIATKRVNTIAEELTAYYSNETRPGLMDGLAGISCFFFHYYHFSGIKKYEKHAFIALEKIITSIENGFSQPSFAGGLAGIHWLFRYLGQKGFISKEDSNILKDLKPMFLAFAQSQFSLSQFDYLHGALGMHIALLDHRVNNIDLSPNETNRLPTMIKKELSRMIVKHNEDSIYWEAFDSNNGQKEINMGMAHGVPSILLILSRIYRTTKDDDILKSLIIPGINFLQLYSEAGKTDTSIFPTTIINGKDISPSRMAWCYGDPGIGSALLQIGENCKQTSWINFGSSILLNSAGRRKQAETFISDACLCHGSSGLAMMYYQAGMATGNKVFFDTADYWSNITLNFGYSNNTTSGYNFRGNKNHYGPQYSLLDGISGVGLFLLAMIEGEMPGWEKGLLLS